MTAKPTPSAVDLLRFLTLSVAVHADAICCAVDDNEVALVESSTNDEHLETLENELVVLLDRQRRVHAARSMIALSQNERHRGIELRRRPQPLTQQYGDKRIQTSRTPSHKSVSMMLGTDRRTTERPFSNTGTDEIGAVDEATAASTRGLSTAASSTAPRTEPEAESVDAQVERLKANIMHLDRYSLRGKLLQIKKQKKAIKEIDLEDLVAKVIDTFEFPASVRALWSSESPPRSDCSRGFSCAEKAGTSRSRVHPRDMSLAQHAIGQGGLVNHTNIDLLLTRACQRLSGRAADALRALSSTNVSDESAPAHLLGCVVYAGEFDSSESTDLAAVQQLQTMPRNTLSRLYAQCLRTSVFEADLDERCFGARGTVLAAQDFNALPTDWATAQSLSRVPLDEILPPAQHLLTPRFSFADVAELKRLQAKRVELQEKIVRFLVDGQEKEAELLQGIAGSGQDRVAAAARLALAEVASPSTSPHTWRTLLLPRDDEG
ncbi:hypothetical protein JKF63_01782 [Porcisia hertigi]|uniref:Uncharacterized protein n=1 Tax=Porcisia hertigi TaxID=2761500 RepID=A0A836I017_9TRYP|nr:hypothetical protein JKF63_01782 [Porcisia hertigi]